MALEPQIFLTAEVLTPLKRGEVRRQSLSVAVDRLLPVGTTKLQLLAVANPFPGVRLAGQRSSHAIPKEVSGGRPPPKPGVSAVQAGVTKGHSVHLQQGAEILDFLEIQEEPSAVRIGPSAPHLPEVAAFPAETVMGAVVRSDAAVVGVAQEASPVAVLAGEGAFPVAVSQVVMVGVAEDVNSTGFVKSKRGSIGPLFLFLRTCDETTSTFSYQKWRPSRR